MGEHWLTGSGFMCDDELRRAREVEGYGVGYTQYEFDAGYRYQLKLESLPSWASRAGPDVRLGYSVIAGDPGNIDSGRRQGELRAGWRHYLFDGKIFRPFVQPRVGLGKGTLQSNFGGGEIDIPEVPSTTLNMQALAGVGICVSERFCVDFFAGYQWERSVATDPAYLNNGTFFGIDVSALPWGEPERARPASEEGRVVAPTLPPPPPPPLVLSEIFFAHRSTDIPPEAFGYLDSVAAAIRSYPFMRIRLHGYGNDEEYQGTNRVYSLKRAMAVRDYLVARGVSPVQIDVDGEFIPSPRDASRMVDARRESAHGGVQQFGDSARDERNRFVRFELIADGNGKEMAVR